MRTIAHPLCPPFLPTCAVAEREALRQARDATVEQRSALRQVYLDAARARPGGRSKDTGVRWWLKFCVYARGVSPYTHLTALSAHHEKVEAEQLLCDFAIWLAMCKPSGQPISAGSISKYISQVRMWHLENFRTHICGDLGYKQLRDTIKGICREIAQPPRMRRYGVRTQQLSEALRRFLSGSTAEEANWSAALTVAFCGLLRGAEFALQDGERWSSVKHLTRADIRFEVGENGKTYVVVRMRPAKGPAGQGKWVPLLLGGGGSLLDPVKALQRLEALDPVADEMRARTPLFRRRDGRSLTVSGVRGMVQSLMRLLGEDPARFGAHSLRIGGATAALTARMSPAEIRAAGRWSSDCYMLYTRATKQLAVGMATIIGSTPFEDMERGVAFADEELLLIPAEMPYSSVDSFVEADMIADAFVIAEEDY